MENQIKVQQIENLDRAIKSITFLGELFKSVDPEILHFSAGGLDGFDEILLGICEQVQDVKKDLLRRLNQ